MADVFLFMRHGWKSIWKQKTIWLFSMLPILTQLFNIFRAERKTDFLSSFIFLIASFFFIILKLDMLKKLPKLSPLKDPGSIILNGSWQLT